MACPRILGSTDDKVTLGVLTGGTTGAFVVEEDELLDE
jgi:hypothetical protein